MSTSRSDFNQTWLTEMPARLGNFGETFSILEPAVKEWEDDGHIPHQIEKNVFKLVGENIIYFYIKKDNDIAIIAEVEKKPQGYLITVVGKNPKYNNLPPYATDLYEIILNNSPYSLLFSDNQLSDDGIKLWKKLISKSNNVVSVYNSKDPSKTFKTLTSEDDLENYIGADHYYDRFVLSKRGKTLAETRSFFNTRRMRELCGFSLED